MRLTHLGFLTAILLLSACAIPIRVRSLDRPMPSSETSGRRHKISVGAHLGSRPNLELTPDLKRFAPTTDQPDLKMVEDGGLFGEFAITPKLDVGFDYNLHELMLRGKFQLLGSPLQTTSAGNFSLAFVGGLGGTASDYSDTGSTTVLSHHHTSLAGDIGVVAGIRATDWLLFYSGVSGKYVEYKGNYKTAITGVGSGDFAGQEAWGGPFTGIEVSRRRFRYRMSFGYSAAGAGSIRKNLFSSQGELTVALGSVND